MSNEWKHDDLEKKIQSMQKFFYSFIFLYYTLYICFLVLLCVLCIIDEQKHYNSGNKKWVSKIVSLKNKDEISQRYQLLGLKNTVW